MLVFSLACFVEKGTPSEEGQHASYAASQVVYGNFSVATFLINMEFICTNLWQEERIISNKKK